MILTVTVRVNEPQPNGTLIVNTAAVTNTNGGPITPTSTVTTPLASGHSISIEKRVSPAIAAPGDRVTYTLAYTISGNEAALGVTLSDTLPAGVSFVSSIPAPTSQNGQTQVWSLGTLSPTTAIPAAGVISLVGQLSSAPTVPAPLASSA